MPLYDYLVTHPYGALDPSVVPTAPVTYAYRPDIVALRTTTPSLEGVITVGLALTSRIDTYINSILRSWFLQPGPADPTDPNGQVAPLDYDASTNDVHWQQG